MSVDYKAENPEKLYHASKDIQFFCPYCKHSNKAPVWVDKRPCCWCKKMINNTSKAYFRKKMKELLK